MAASKLDALLAIISSGVAEIKHAYASAGRIVPDLDTPYVPDIVEPSLETTRALVVAAASQLVAAVGNPGKLIIETTAAVLMTETLDVILKLHVPEIVREAGEDGISAHDIAVQCGTSPDKLDRFMRYAASHHIFKETKPGIFKENRLSSVLDTRKSYDAIATDPLSKFESPDGMAPIAGHLAGGYLPIAPHMARYMCDPEWALSSDIKCAPFAYSRGKKQTLWEHHSTPGNEQEQAQFSAAMVAQQRMMSGSILSGFAWNNLPQASLVVDVAGGIGSASLDILRAYPHLRFIVQDLPATVADGRKVMPMWSPNLLHTADCMWKYWETECPEAAQSGQVHLQEHDMFTPQPVHGAAVYLLRFVTHDWPDAEVQLILRELARAASPDSKLLLIDFVVQSTCREEDTMTADSSVPGVQRSVPPVPLLQTAGEELALMADIMMLNMFNAKERTMANFQELFKNSGGWALSEVIHGGLHLPSHLVLSLRG